ncbi:thioredoxin [Hokovirus HKV1]|uniref:Thioredoxin n=1 Tax=Hokovirus HKV1 TaxID=1977638 RepID=A0A1V0SGK4_9VIRU|nr:thioredoxin [Hokovirus HKV1]
MYKLVETEEEFEDIVMNGEYDHICINFGTTFCSSCKIFQPIYESVSNMEKYKNIAFLKINMDKVDNVGELYNINKWPTIILLDKGDLKTTYNPYICYDKTLEKFEEYLCILNNDDLVNDSSDDF